METPPTPADWPDSQNLGFVEELLLEWQRDPRSVTPEWAEWFAANLPRGAGQQRLGPSFRPAGLFQEGAPQVPSDGEGSQEALLTLRAEHLARAFRVRGHLAASLDPLGLPRPPQVELDPSFHRIRPADLEKEVMTSSGRVRLCDWLERLRNTYCRSIGVQYMHIDDLATRQWLEGRMERGQNRLEVSPAEQRRILTHLTDAVGFEDFLQKKFLGAKRFSLEGSESIIPLLDLSMERLADKGVEEVVLGMAHRGRLTVLTTILGKAPREIFREFDDADAAHNRGRGDVKYHLGHRGRWRAASGRELEVSLCFNPSHLEFVNPVALGRVRARQERTGDRAGQRSLAILLHGDAAFIGQGVTQETFNLSEVEAYGTGGAIHVVLNNQIGFTTGPQQARSSTYCTDVAKMLQIPVFHVNGEDPEAVAQVVSLAVDFRMQFSRDVVIDMYCYRRYGHNEGDEPAFTQPTLYRAIRARKSVREGYLEHLLKLGGLTRQEADEIERTRREHLDQELTAARGNASKPAPQLEEPAWKSYFGGLEARADDPRTGAKAEELSRLLSALSSVPSDFHPHPTLARLLALRQQMAQAHKPLDWGAAESLAYASLLVEGVPVRMTGQDCERGTFSHRHAVLHDVETGARCTPMQQLAAGQARLEIHNSVLSETAVLGFEYGYSLDRPEALVLWEAQFGDFCNVAQVVIDQFLVSAEDKWRRLSALTLLLPHGFEGQGPEHSSARLERFLMLSADDNIQVCVPSTPAQIFHLLRRQALRRWKKPLVVFTPKSLLRHPRVVSGLEELAEGRFEKVLDESLSAQARKQVRRVLLCSGKLYYELLETREQQQRSDVAIVRLEQLYPLPQAELQRVLASFPAQASCIWVQEEPANMGAWRYLHAHFGAQLCDRPLSGVSRPASASPATGSPGSHKLEQLDLIAAALGAAPVAATRRS